MKVVDRFDRLVTAEIRATSQDDTLVARLSANLSHSQGKLYEVWLESPTGFLPPWFVEKACFNSAVEMGEYYDPTLTPALPQALRVQANLLHHFAPTLCRDDAEWNYQVLPGPIISVVFGTKVAMEKMYEAGLRPRRKVPA